MDGVRTIRRHRNRCVLVASFILASVSTALAGGGWVDDPGRGSIRLGYDWKIEPNTLRRDIKGDLYQAIYSTTLNYRFLYLSADAGILPGLEGSCLFTYLWAEETVDSTSEEPSHFFHGISDMWLGLKYQVVGGEFPVAVSATVRLPNLYEASSTLNGQPLTEVPGLLKRDYELNVSGSHSFPIPMYAQATLGFRLREGVAANQMLYSGEVGYTPPILDNRLLFKVGFDGVASVGEPGKSTSRDRFSGLSHERDDHWFDFNNASYFRPQLGIGVNILPTLNLSGGFSYIVWGHSTLVYEDFLIQLGYSF